jgi:hypothetical protein
MCQEKERRKPKIKIKGTKKREPPPMAFEGSLTASFRVGVGSHRH